MTDLYLDIDLDCDLALELYQDPDLDQNIDQVKLSEALTETWHDQCCEKLTIP